MYRDQEYQPGISLLGAIHGSTDSASQSGVISSAASAEMDRADYWAKLPDDNRWSNMISLVVVMVISECHGYSADVLILLSR